MLHGSNSVIQLCMLGNVKLCSLKPQRFLAFKINLDFCSASSEKDKTKVLVKYFTTLPGLLKTYKSLLKDSCLSTHVIIYCYKLRNLACICVQKRALMRHYWLLTIWTLYSSLVYFWSLMCGTERNWIHSKNSVHVFNVTRFVLFSTMHVEFVCLWYKIFFW